MPELIEQLWDRAGDFLRWLGVDNLVVNLVASILAAAILSLFARPLGRLLRRAVLAVTARLRRWAGGPAPPDEPDPQLEAERRYLAWLANGIYRFALEWHEAPIVPTPASGKRPHGWRERWRAVLFRYDPLDYLRNPALADSELSLRAGFGRRVRIRDLARELRKYTKIVVLGDPGSGKSVCLRQLAFDLAERGRREPGRPRTLPVLVDMGAYDGWKDEAAREPEPVFDFLQRALAPGGEVVDAPTSHALLYVAGDLERLLRLGRLTCIFDALDEMPQDGYQERYQALKRFMRTWEPAGNRFVFSCRTLDYDSSFSVDEVIVEPFDRDRIRTFLRRHVPARAEALYQRIADDETLEEIVSNPFLLQALAYINAPAQAGEEEDGGETEEPEEPGAPPHIPTSRGDLIRVFVDTLLRREAQGRRKQRELLDAVPGGVETLRRFLGELGYALQEHREGGTSTRTDALAEIWQRYPRWRELLWVARRARILGKRGAGTDRPAAAAAASLVPPARVEFVHHRLQEFFAAEELARRLALGEAVERYLEDIWWQETVLLAIGIVPDPRSILERILAPREEVTRWARKVASEAAGFVPRASERKPETAERAAADIDRCGQRWRRDRFDVALVVMLLARVKKILANLQKDSPEESRWKSIKTQGEQLSRRRAIFVATEAAGQVAVRAVLGERHRLREDLGILVEEGNSLQKVRALRAMRFLASADCVPVLERGLADASPWVRATALRTLFRLNLRERGPRAVLVRFLLRSFWNCFNLVGFFRESGGPKNAIPVRGLVSGLWSERGGRSLALLTVALWGVTVVWFAALVLTTVSLFTAVSTVAFSLGLVVGAAVSPVLVRVERTARPWNILRYAALDYGAAACALLLPGPEQAWGALGIYGMCLLMTWSIEVEPRAKEAVRTALRGAFLLFLAALIPGRREVVWSLAALAVVQLAWVAFRFVSPCLRRRAPSELGIWPLVVLALLAVFTVALPMALLMFPAVLLLVALFVSGDWFVQSLRVRLAGRRSQFQSFPDYLAYAIYIARDPSLPLSARIWVVLTLMEIPLADPGVLEQLLDVADEEDLPPKVRDAFHQVVDAAEKRLERGQVAQVKLEPVAVFQTPLPSVRPGKLLQPYVAVALSLLCLLALSRAAAGLGGGGFAEAVAWGELVVGCLLMLSGLLTLGRQSEVRRWVMVLGAGLVGLVLSRPAQAALAAAWEGGGVLFDFLDTASLLSIWLAFMACCTAAMGADVLYLLDSDSPARPENRRALLAGAVLGLALLGGLVQSVPFGEYIAARSAPLPRFEPVASGGLALASLPEDGRVVRVALNQLSEPGKLPGLTETFPPLGVIAVKAGAFSGEEWRRIPLEKAFAGDEPCKGEVWIARGAQGIRVWESLPGGCLEAQPAKPGRVLLRVRPACRLEPPLRLVAIVYTLERSTVVTRRASPEKALEEFRTLKPSERLLGDTLSPSARAVWSPPVKASLE